VGMMSGLLVVSRFVTHGSFVVMFGRQLMMLRCFFVMFNGFLGHAIPPQMCDWYTNKLKD
jgi:hypothetical protein